VTPSDARPSSIGEILDRAVTAYVRRLLPLFVIVALVAIPAGLLGAFASPSFGHVVAAVNQIVTLPPGDTLGRARIMRELNGFGRTAGLIWLFYLVQLLVYPLARTALVIFAAKTLDGRVPTIASAYRAAVKRWLPQIIVTIGFLGIAMALIFAFVFAGVFGGLTLYAVGAGSRAAAIVVGVILALVAFAGLIVVVALAYTAWLMASVSVAIEDANPVRAIGTGLRRALDRPLLRRTLAVALAIVALDWFGSLAILAFAALVEYFTHITVLYAVVGACAAILLDGLRTVFVLLYMRDVRLRREGSDLLLAAEAPTLA
jgi:hypothetical protein